MYAINLPICTVVLYVRLWLMIFLCPFLHCKALRTAMYKRYINSTIIIIIIIIIIIVWVTAETIYFNVISAKRYCYVKEQAVCVTTFDQSEWIERFSRLEGAVFRYVYGETFGLLHSCVGNFDSISSWKVVGTMTGFAHPKKLCKLG